MTKLRNCDMSGISCVSDERGIERVGFVLLYRHLNHDFYSLFPPFEQVLSSVRRALRG